MVGSATRALAHVIAVVCVGDGEKRVGGSSRAVLVLLVRASVLITGCRKGLRNSQKNLLSGFAMGVERIFLLTI